MYTSFIYNDPVTRQFAPRSRSAARILPAERSLTFCALYDNGYTDPTWKRQSTSPTPIGIPACSAARAQTDGLHRRQVGEACSGATPQQLNASCDSSPGAGDGVCDACPLPAASTEDEMFIRWGRSSSSDSLCADGGDGARAVRPRLRRRARAWCLLALLLGPRPAFARGTPIALTFW